MADLAPTPPVLARSSVVGRSHVVTVGLRRVLASLLVTVVIVSAVAFVSNSSREILRTTGDVAHTVSTPTVVAYGWSWWPFGFRTVYSDQTETVELW